MKKNNILTIFIIVFIIVILTGIVATTIIINKKQEKESINIATTTVGQRQIWNEFLNLNPYLSQITTIPYVEETDLIKLAITSEKVETERIITEEIEQNSLLALGDGYKKSRNNINKYIKNLLGQEEIAYNFVETHIEDDDYLIIGEEYVYYTKIKLPEKIYIAMTYAIENNNYEVLIYEYNVTEENKETLTKMLETGENNEKIETTSKYILTGQIENGTIKINTKTISE